jgi:hypothetical protein
MLPIAQLLQAGISMRSVDKLFGKMDTSGDGLISEAEFCKAIARICDLIREDHAFEDKLSQTRPDQYVVPGSYRMNQLSGTQSFGMKVLK